MKSQSKFSSHSIIIEKKTILKFIWNPKRLQKTKTIMNKKNTGRIAIPDLKIYCRIIEIRRAWHWHRNRHVDQWNKIQDPGMSTCNFILLIFDKSKKKVSWREESIFNTWCWENRTSTCRTIKSDPCLPPCIKTNPNRSKM